MWYSLQRLSCLKLLQLPNHRTRMNPMSLSLVLMGLLWSPAGCSSSVRSLVLPSSRLTSSRGYGEQGSHKQRSSTPWTLWTTWTGNMDTSWPKNPPTSLPRLLCLLPARLPPLLPWPPPPLRRASLTTSSHCHLITTLTPLHPLYQLR